VQKTEPDAAAAPPASSSTPTSDASSPSSNDAAVDAPDAADAATNVITFSIPDNGKTVSVANNQAFAVLLPHSSGTCTTWDVVNGTSVLGEPTKTIDPPLPQFPGSAATSRFQWVAKTGTHVLIFDGGPGPCSFDITVTVN